jgi:hypothetical protein
MDEIQSGPLEKTYPSICGKKISLWVIVFLDLHFVENRFFG